MSSKLLGLTTSERGVRALAFARTSSDASADVLRGAGVKWRTPTAISFERLPLPSGSQHELPTDADHVALGNYGRALVEIGETLMEIANVGDKT